MHTFVSRPQEVSEYDKWPREPHEGHMTNGNGGDRAEEQSWAIIILINRPAGLQSIIGFAARRTIPFSLSRYHNLVGQRAIYQLWYFWINFSCFGRMALVCPCQRAESLGRQSQLHSCGWPHREHRPHLVSCKPHASDQWRILADTFLNSSWPEFLCR